MKWLSLPLILAATLPAGAQDQPAQVQTPATPRSFHYGFQLRPMVFVAPNHIRNVGINTGTITGKDKALLVFSGGLAPQFGWKNVTFRAGPTFNYPIRPYLDNTVSVDKSWTVGGYGELQYNVSQNFFVLGGYSFLPYRLKLEAAGRSVPISTNRINQVYGGAGFKYFVLYLGPAWENLALGSQVSQIPVKRGLLLGAGVVINFSWY